jgi:hypothetical protein
VLGLGQGLGLSRRGVKTGQDLGLGKPKGCIKMRQFKYRDFSSLKVGQRVAVCGYGASYQIGTVTHIETFTNMTQNETFLRLTMVCESHYDAYKSSQGITPSSGTVRVSEYYERPVLTQAQFETRRGVSL